MVVHASGKAGLAPVAAKTAYIKKHKLGGAYVWALNDDDESASLTEAIAASLR